MATMFSMRSFLWFLMIAMGAGAIYFANDAIRYSNKLESWITATPAEFPVDLSQSGKFEGPLELFTTRPCKILFSLKVDTDQRVDRSLLGGLSGHFYLYAGKELLQILPLNEECCNGWPVLSDNMLALLRIEPWEIGKYRVVVSAGEPAIKLKGIKQTLIVKYELCGMEYWPDYIHKGFVIFFGLACLIIGLYLYSTRPIQAVLLEQSRSQSDKYLR